MADNTCLPHRRAPLSQLFQPDLAPEARRPSAIGATVPVTIDGIETKVPLGTTILEAAKSIGVRIPTLCYHPDLEVAGICRICVVEVEGQRTLQAACAYPITAPIKIKTYSKAVRIARRHVLDLLLSEHCGDCYSCIRNGICELQRWPRSTGSTASASATSKSPVADRRLELLGRPRHEQVHPLPPLRAHLHRHAGSGRAGGREPLQQGGDLHLHGEAAGRRGLHQLRPVHQPLPHRGPLRQARPSTRCGRPWTTPPSTWSSRPPRRRAPPWARCFGLEPGTTGHLRDEHRPQAHGLRPRVRHQLHRRPHHHRGRHRAHPASV